MNEDVRDTFKMRAKIIHEIKCVLEDEYDFMFAAAQAVPTASAPVSASKPNFFHFPLKTMSLLIRLELLRC